MIEITGEWKGEVVEEKLVSAQELVDTFKLPFKKGDRIHFRLHSSVKTFDIATKRDRYAEERMFKPLINGRYNGGSFIMRYYEQKLNLQRKSEKVRYLPVRLRYKGDETIWDTQRNFELAVFMYLSTMCADSPLRNRRSQKHWEYYEPNVEAEANLKAIERTEALRLRVMEMTDDEVLYTALAIKQLRGMIPSNVKLDTPALARLALVNISMNNPAPLHTALNSVQIEAAAVILEAQDKNMIAMVNEKGARIWIWSEELGGTVLHKIPTKTGSPLHKLIEHLTSTAQGLVDFKNKVKNGADIVEKRDEILKQTAPPETDEEGESEDDLSDIDEMSPGALIDLAMSLGVALFHPEERKFYLTNEKGQITGRALKSNLDQTDWKTQLAGDFPKNSLGKLKKHIKEAL
jgi:hypothetical protein